MSAAQKEAHDKVMARSEQARAAAAATIEKVDRNIKATVEREAWFRPLRLRALPFQSAQLTLYDAVVAFKMGGEYEALETTVNYCWTGGVVDCRLGAATKRAISQTKIAERNCEGKSDFGSEERELSASGEKRKIERFEASSFHSRLRQEVNCRCCTYGPRLTLGESQ